MPLPPYPINALIFYILKKYKFLKHRVTWRSGEQKSRRPMLTAGLRTHTTNQTKAKATPPEEVIPLDDDFSEF